jgi:creatinine amidohydrolase/Fe(II)-dependent formamide hydrolase-like protein
MTKPTLRLVALLGAVGPATQQAPGQVYHVAELNTDQILALDRRKTVVILPGGILEQHGPYLPSYTDGYYNERLSSELASAIAARGWNALVFPVVPLGAGGANQIGSKFSFPGTYAIRPSTLRAIFMDLGTELGDQGFRWIFLIHGHGSPNHNQALDDAGDYFRDTYGGHMVHLLGLAEAGLPDSVTASLPPAVRTEDGFTVHAGVIEHSTGMALRPDLVPPTIANAPSVTARTFPDLRRLAAQPNWTGYFGAPRYASPDLGRQVVELLLRRHIALALRILDGQDERLLPRYARMITEVPGVAAVVGANAAHDAAMNQRQRAWVARHRHRSN